VQRRILFLYYLDIFRKLTHNWKSFLNLLGAQTELRLWKRFEHIGFQTVLDTK